MTDQPIRIKCTDHLKNVAWIVRHPNGRVTCTLDNGTPCSMSYAGVIGSEESVKYQLSDITDGDHIVAFLNVAKPRGQTYEWVNRPENVPLLTKVEARPTMTSADHAKLVGFRPVAYCDNHTLDKLVTNQQGTLSGVSPVAHRREGQNVALYVMPPLFTERDTGARMTKAMVEQLAKRLGQSTDIVDGALFQVTGDNLADAIFILEQLAAQMEA